MTLVHSGQEASVPTEKADMSVLEIDRLRAALEPFAAYMQQMDAYAILHRGKHLPDDMVLAYGQTEMGTCAALVVGHFRDAAEVFGGRAKGWGGLYRSAIRPQKPTSANAVGMERSGVNPKDPTS